MATTIYVREDRLKRVRFEPSSDERRLRSLTLAAGALLVVQAIAVAVLSDGSSRPVTATSLTEQGLVPVLREVARVALGPAVAGLLVVSGVLHLLIAPRPGFEAYVRDLRRGRNRFRWIEHGASAPATVVLVALLAGISDVAALAALFALTAAAILLPLQAEARVPGRPVPLAPVVAGGVTGAIAWSTIGLYAWSGARSHPPAFVGRLYLSLFVLHVAIAVNQWLQYARAGPWRRHETGEVAYVVLGGVAKSLLAWQVVVGALLG